MLRLVAWAQRMALVGALVAASGSVSAVRADSLVLKDRSGDTFDLWLPLPDDIIAEQADEDGENIVRLTSYNEFIDIAPESLKLRVLRSGTAVDCEAWVAQQKKERSDRKVLDERVEALECFLATETDRGQRLADWRFWVPECACFVRTYGWYTKDSRDIFNYLAQPLVDAFREQAAAPFEDRSAASRLVMQRDPTVPPGVVDIAQLEIEIGEAQRRSRAAANLREELRNKLRARLAARTARKAAPGPSVAARPEPPPVSHDSVVFDMENGTGRQLLLVFTEHRTPGQHSPTGHKWPGGGKAWILPPGARQEYPLKCRPGRNVCFGLEFDEDQKEVSGVFWGNSLTGDQGCSDCCLVCGGKRTGRKLTWDGRRYPQSSSRRSGGGQAADILEGFLAGIALGNALAPPRGSGGGAAPRAPAYRPSGISGLD